MRSQQQIRDAVAAAKEVDVVTTWGNGSQTKTERVRVLEVVRAAARVRFPDGKVILVRFDRIRLIEEEKPSAPTEPKRRGRALATIGDAVSARAHVPEPAHEPPQVRQPPPVAEATASALSTPARAPLTATTDATDEIEAWLSMGRGLVDPIEAELMRLRAEGESLEAEKQAIEDQLDELSLRMKALHDRRTRVLDALNRAEGKR